MESWGTTLPALQWNSLWPNSHLQYPIAPITKNPIPFRNLIKRQGMREEWPKINTPSSHRFHKSPHALFPAWAKSRHNALITDPAANAS